MNAKYKSIPLVKENIQQYIKDEYNADRITISKEIKDIEPLLQANYGGDNDCTLTSITTIIHSKVKDEPIENIYNTVEKIAKKHGYTSGYGTFSFTVKSIYEKALKEYGLAKSTKWKIIKNIGIKIKDLIWALNDNTPIILNFLSDGRKYQGNHTVLIIGYDIIKVNNKDYYLLKLYDNWNNVITYMDWQKLSYICSVNY